MKKIILFIFLFLQYHADGAVEKENIGQLVNNAEKGVMTPANNRKDQALLQSKEFSALEKITPAPLAVALLAQIVLVSAQYKTDFAIQCPRTGCKHMEYPDSFKASLLQMSFAAYDAFNKAHVNMDEIQMLTKTIPHEVRSAVMTLIQGEDVEIEILLPEQLRSLRYIAQSSRVLSNETVTYFEKVKVLLEEIIAGGTSTKFMSSKEVSKLKERIEAQKKWEEHYKSQKEEFEQNKSELKDNLKKSKESFEKAMEDLPSGWDVIGMNLSESLAKTAAGLVDGLSTMLTLGLNKLIPGESLAKTSAGLVDGLSGLTLGLNKIITGDVNAGPDNNTETASNRQEMKIPNCLGRFTTNIDEKKNENIEKMEKAEATKTAIEFISAITDLIRVEDILQQFYANIYVINKSSKEISLNKDGEEHVAFLKKSISEQKGKLDSNSKIPEFMKGKIVSFYQIIYDLADRLKDNLKKQLSKDNKEKLKKDTKNLMDASRCFNTWAKQTLETPAMDTPLPFNKDNSASPNSKLASTIATENAQMKVQMFQQQLDNTQLRYEHNNAQLLVTNEKLTEALNKLNEFNGAKATLEQIISILQDALQTLSELRKNWLQILEFFQQIESLIDVGLGNTLDDLGNRIEAGASIRQRISRIPNTTKNAIYGYLQQTMTSGYLVNRMSAVYIDISTRYIMPPVRELGIMMETKDMNKIVKLKEDIMKQADEANNAILKKINEEGKIFDAAVKKRKNEIKSSFKPILDQYITPERKQELAKLTKTATDVIPKVTTTTKKDTYNWV